MKWPLALNEWNADEKDAIRAVLEGDQVTLGPQVEAFEAALARQFGSRFAVMVNSGSSANLLMAAALLELEDARVTRGDEIIVPAVAWGTTYFPFTQLGMNLRVVDIDPQTLNMTCDAVEAAITPRTRAVVAVSLLGRPAPLEDLRSLCEQRGLVLLEDACEASGSREGERHVGTLGRMGSLSFYFSHHMSTGEGGAVLTNDPVCHDLLVTQREHGWARRWPADSTRFHIPQDPWERNFCFILPGFNVRPMEFQAAAGLVQLLKLPGIVAQRRENADLLQQALAELPEVSMQAPHPGSSWFGFGLTLPERLWCQRPAIAGALGDAGIASRPVVGGNICAQPVAERLPLEAVGPLPAADAIHRGGLMLGNHSGRIGDVTGIISEVLRRFIRSR